MQILGKRERDCNAESYNYFLTRFKNLLKYLLIHAFVRNVHTNNYINDPH